MRTGFTILLLFVIIQAKSQTIEKYFNYSWKECEPNEARFYCTITKSDSGYMRNDYFIHEKSLQMSGKYDDIDCKIRNGFFYFFYPNEVLESTGQYIHGKKEGLWLKYHNNKMMSDSTFYHSDQVIGKSLAWHPNGYIQDSTVVNIDGSSIQVTWFDNGSPSSAGRYSADNKPIGRWNYFHRNGQLSSDETYQNGVLIEKKHFDENGVLSNESNDVDRDATFPGGDKAWKKYILKKLYFPDQYKIVNSDKAIVVVTFSINEEGEVVDVYTSTPFYPAFDRIAEKTMKTSPNWLPAIKHNRRTKSVLSQAVVFEQQ